MEITGQLLRDWEMDAGESFTDYFLHSQDNLFKFGQWLIKNGHPERGAEIVKHCEESRFEDQDMFHVHYDQEMSWGDWDAADAIYTKDFHLWAAFINDDERLRARFISWWKDWNREDEE